METRKVSVIIPTYRRSEMLGRAINSALQQTYNNIEVLVIDDNNDADSFRKETELFMKSYQNNKKVIYIKHHKNKNGSAARNTGIRQSKGDYISFLDDDDFWLPKKIEEQINLIESLDTSYGGVFCLHVRRYNEYAYYESKYTLKENGNYCAELLSNEISMPSSTLLFKKEVLNEIGFFDESFIRHQDIELLIRFFRKNKLAVIPSYLVVMQTEGFRNYPSGQTAYKIKTKFFQTFQSDIDTFPQSQRKKIYHYHWLGVISNYLMEGKVNKGIKLYKMHIVPNSNSFFKDIFHISFFLLIFFIPLIKVSYCFIIGSTRLRKFSYQNYITHTKPLS